MRRGMDFSGSIDVRKEFHPETVYLGRIEAKVGELDGAEKKIQKSYGLFKKSINFSIKKMNFLLQAFRKHDKLTTTTESLGFTVLSFIEG